MKGFLIALIFVCSTVQAQRSGTGAAAPAVPNPPAAPAPVRPLPPPAVIDPANPQVSNPAQRNVLRTPGQAIPPGRVFGTNITPSLNPPPPLTNFVPVQPALTNVPATPMEDPTRTNGFIPGRPFLTNQFFPAGRPFLTNRFQRLPGRPFLTNSLPPGTAIVSNGAIIRILPSGRPLDEAAMNATNGFPINTNLPPTLVTNIQGLVTNVQGVVTNLPPNTGTNLLNQ